MHKYSRLSAKQIIRTINIDLLLDNKMNPLIKDIYDNYSSLCNNLHLGRINNVNYHHQCVILNDIGEVICMFSNDYTNLHICKRLINKIRLEISPNIYNEDILYLLKYFIKEKFPNVFKHELDDMYVIKTNTKSLKNVSDTIKIELV